MKWRPAGTRESYRIADVNLSNLMDHHWSADHWLVTTGIEEWKSGVFTGRRANWNSWSLEFKVDRLGSRIGLDYGEH